MEFNIAVIKGDGIGPEVINEGLKVLEKIASEYNHKFNYYNINAGGVAIDETNGKTALTNENLELCKKMDAVLLGAVGGKKWDNLSGNIRPEQALLSLRAGLKLYCNLRPAILYEELKEASPLKNSIIGEGIDICVVRELTGGIYFGKKELIKNGDVETAKDTEEYSTIEIERITRIAFETARKRNKKVTSVDKANILESSRLWRRTVDRIHKEYKDICVEHMYIDNAAMQLIKNPKQFDVILTSNMFGDILSDEASMITGSIGMLPSASLGDGSIGMYEPIHGSAPDIANLGLANPLATILSIAMMLRYSFSLEKEAIMIENAVKNVLSMGYRTKDIESANCKVVGTEKMGNLVCENIIKG
ncbi:MAG: 3-isopropylmalate dehydrogenase [Sarcina sp.]